MQNILKLLIFWVYYTIAALILSIIFSFFNFPQEGIVHFGLAFLIAIYLTSRYSSKK